MTTPSIKSNIYNSLISISRAPKFTYSLGILLDFIMSWGNKLKTKMSVWLWPFVVWLSSFLPWWMITDLKVKFVLGLYEQDRDFFFIFRCFLHQIQVKLNVLQSKSMSRQFSVNKIENGLSDAWNYQWECMHIPGTF